MRGVPFSTRTRLHASLHRLRGQLHTIFFKVSTVSLGETLAKSARRPLPPALRTFRRIARACTARYRLKREAGSVCKRFCLTEFWDEVLIQCERRGGARLRRRGRQIVTKSAPKAGFFVATENR